LAFIRIFVTQVGTHHRVEMKLYDKHIFRQ